MLQLFDTARGEVRPLETREAGKVSMYVCGPTVYGPPHLGHGRFVLVFDVLRRYLLWSGFEVTYVSNITDIDDKIIGRARDEGRTAAEVAEEYERVWYESVDALGVMRPDMDPHATAYVDQMVALIGRLVRSEAAYVAPDGVYLRPRTVADYGLLARQSLDSLQAGARVAVDETKESPIDFALWKLAGDEDPGPTWESPWGRGRPGWHTECVVMSLDLLGEGFDLHGGGQDLAFPHHENERAQAVADGRRFASHWVHNGFVESGGEKMSKSLGNVTNLVDLLAQHDPRTYRMLVLQAHYRSPVEVTSVSLANAEAALGRLDNLVRRAKDLDLGSPDPVTVTRFRERMDDDLDTPGAMSLVFGAVTDANRLFDAGDAAAAGPVVAAMIEMCSAVGLSVVVEDEVVPDEVLALARERDAARAEQDWARSDSIRDRLESEGWQVSDTADGTEVRRRP